MITCNAFKQTYQLVGQGRQPEARAVQALGAITIRDTESRNVRCNCAVLLLHQIESEPRCLLHVSCAPIYGAHLAVHLHVLGVSPFLFPHYPPFYYPPSIPHFPPMSHAYPTSTSSDFQLIFDEALKAYKKRTKTDLLTHPLADRLETCHSASSILEVLQGKVQELNQSQQRNETWARWLDPTVKVLHAFSETLRKGVGLVCLISSTSLRSALLYLFDRPFHRQNPSLLQSVSSF